MTRLTKRLAFTAAGGLVLGFVGQLSILTVV